MALGPSFCSKKIDAEQNEHLATFQPCFGEAPLPGRRQLRFVLRNAGATAPGHDGVPTHAWGVGGRFSENVLADALWEILCGRTLGWRFNASFLVSRPECRRLVN